MGDLIEQKIPKGWIYVELGQIASINPKLPYNSIENDLNVSFLPMKDVEEVTGRFNLDTIRKYDEVRKGYTSFIDGDIIFAKITPCMENGKVAVLKDLKNGIGFGSTEFHVLRLTLFTNKKYTFYYITQQSFRREARKNMTGSAGQLRVPVSFLEKSKIPLPPLAEQKRIVAKIEELFSELDNGINNLKQAQKQLKIYRQAVLKYAFEGKLTEEWRLLHPQATAEELLEQIKAERERQYQEQLEAWKKSQSVTPLFDGESTKPVSKPKKLVELRPLIQAELAELPELPKGWCWIKLGEISNLISGQHILADEYNVASKGIPYLTGPADFGDKYPIITKWTEFPKAIAEKNDILITVKGAGVGKLNVLDIEEAAISRQLMAVQPLIVVTMFLYNFLYSNFYKFQKLGLGSTVPGIDRDNILSFPVPICSVEEQNQVDEEVDSRISVTDKLEETIKISLRKAEALRQSILKQAFEGKLVAQDPNDEPASVLLERIKAEKAKAQTIKKQVDQLAIFSEN